MEVAVRSDVVHVGFDDCGTPEEALYFYVVAEAADGARFAHNQGYTNVVSTYDAEEGCHFFARDWDGVAEASAERLARRVRAHLAAGGTLDLDAHWGAIDPAYGSAAYQDLDAVGYFVARERHEAREAGEAVGFDHWADAHFA